MKNARHTTAILEATVTQIHGQLTAVIQALVPHKRQTLLKMGDKSLAFVEKVHDYAVDNPALFPSYLDMAAFNADFSDAHGLWNVLTLIKQLEEAVEDTVMAAGSEAFHTALAFYHNAQVAAKDGIPRLNRGIFFSLWQTFRTSTERQKPPPRDVFCFPAHVPGPGADVFNFYRDLPNLAEGIKNLARDVFNVGRDLPNVSHGDVFTSPPMFRTSARTFLSSPRTFFASPPRFRTPVTRF